jgi:hypothetical protein
MPAPRRSAAFQAGERVGTILGLLWYATMTGLLVAAAWLTILHAFRAL